MTKQDFLDNFPDKLLCVPNEDIVRMHATSGTSGHQPTCGFYNQKDLDDWSYLCARNLGAIGMTKKDVFQNTTSAGLFTGGFGYAQGATVLGAMLIPFGAGMTSRQLEFFKTFKVTAFHAIPSFGLRLAQVMEEEGIPVNDIGSVIINEGIEKCMVEDGVHMNEHGYQLLANTVADFLRQYIS